MKQNFLAYFFVFSFTFSFINTALANSDNATAEKSWTVRTGAGLLYAPAFLGSKDYQMLAVPDLRFAYKDRFFASVQDGIGYNIINKPHWQSGPIAKLAFQRNENGKSPFKFAGTSTKALRGLGDVDTTIELGGYLQYNWRDWSTRLEVRQGINGHNGLINDLNLNYTHDISPLFYKAGPPLILSIGPHVSAVNQNYNQAYFGVDSNQAQRSGLPEYDAHSGILNYGLSSVLVVPLNYHLSATLIASYDRLADDAADAPLVTQRGTPDQAMIGLFLSYDFDFKHMRF